MRLFILALIGIIVFSNSFVAAEVKTRGNKSNESQLNNYQYYTCKVWGFLKYFHSEIANGNIDWDDALLENIETLDTLKSDVAFNSFLLELITFPGETEITTGSKPVLESQLKLNLDLDWINDQIFTEEIKTRLENIYNNFTPRDNVYISEESWSRPDFSSDNKYYDLHLDIVPPKSQKLLAIFRYWNVINYFYPHKHLMDNNWDDVLLEFMPPILDAESKEEYYFSFAKFMTNIDDTHGTNGTTYFFNDLYGRYIVPVVLRYVENKFTVIDKLDENCQLEVGDIIETIGNKTIPEITDSLRQIQFHSNEEYFHYSITTKLLRSIGGPVSVEVLRGSERINFTIPDLWSYYDFKDKCQFYKKDYTQLEHYKKIEKEGYSFLYAHMGHITDEDVPVMFETYGGSEALILDCRNYPFGQCGTMHEWLHDENFTLLYKMIPDAQFPGTSYWMEIHSGTTGQTHSVWQKPVYILFNETTVSAAEFLIIGFESHSQAVKVGNQTAGAQGVVSNIYLPGNLSTRFSGEGVFYSDKTPLHRVGITPDFLVKPTYAGIIEGKDEVLDFALNHYVNSVTKVEKVDDVNGFSLNEVYPNPSNGMMTISYQIPKSAQTQLAIYDMLGQRQNIIEDVYKAAGNYRKSVNTSEMSSGIYFVTLRSGKYYQTKKMILLK